MSSDVFPRYAGTRYVVPLREGGSLPAVVDTDEPGVSFVVKFRGAGQGPKALIAEAIVAGIAVALDLPVPRPAIVDLEDGFGRSEPDTEIQDILRGSSGANFGLAYLRGALAFDAAVDARLLTPEMAANIVWLDAFVTNVDRTARNTNLLVRGQDVWLIDHGAALFFHHRWAGWRDRIQSRFPQIEDHVLLGRAGDLRAADERLRPRLSADTTAGIIGALPSDWLLPEDDEFDDLDALRAGDVEYLVQRLNGPRPWLEEAVAARTRGPKTLGLRDTHRVV
ncbi:MAG: hypothetical protein NVSMB2_10060 [Chloroflexota bacterium]